MQSRAVCEFFQACREAPPGEGTKATAKEDKKGTHCRRLRGASNGLGATSAAQQAVFWGKQECEKERSSENDYDCWSSWNINPVGTEKSEH